MSPWKTTLSTWWAFTSFRKVEYLISSCWLTLGMYRLKTSSSTKTITTHRRMFLVKSFIFIRARYTKRKSLASRYISGLRAREAAGFTSFALAKRPRAPPGPNPESLTLEKRSSGRLRRHSRPWPHTGHAVPARRPEGGRNRGPYRTPSPRAPQPDRGRSPPVPAIYHADPIVRP